MSEDSQASFNPFERMGLDPTFPLDLEELERVYVNLQHRFHPDQLESHDLARLAANQVSSAITQAYHVLKNPLTRAAFFFRQAGKWPLDPIESCAPELLEEMMTLQEQAAQLDTPSTQKAFLENLQKLHDAALENLYVCFQNGAFDMGRAPYYYHRLSYLQKLQNRLFERFG